MDLKKLIQPKHTTRFNFLSCGAGVQSSALALMYAHNMFGPLDGAIFSDTQAEAASLYEWLDVLKGYIAEAPSPFPFYTETHGDLTAATLKVRISKGKGKLPEGATYLKKIIPVFGVRNGKPVADLRRSCTLDYKIIPVRKRARKLAGIKRGQKEVTVTQSIGISYDEKERMKLPHGESNWLQHRWPLIEEAITRDGCKQWMKEHGYEEPPRSACYYCPFHSDREWRRLRDDEPGEFAKAIEFDVELREKNKKFRPDLEMEVFLHRSGKPLSEVNLDSRHKDQLGLDFGAECEGMCGN